jgi:hypothetical protein
LGPRRLALPCLLLALSLQFLLQLCLPGLRLPLTQFLQLLLPAAGELLHALACGLFLRLGLVAGRRPGRDRGDHAPGPERLKLRHLAGPLGGLGLTLLLRPLENPGEHRPGDEEQHDDDLNPILHRSGRF